jgi:hypothetical protein
VGAVLRGPAYPDFNDIEPVPQQPGRKTMTAIAIRNASTGFAAMLVSVLLLAASTSTPLIG